MNIIFTPVIAGKPWNGATIYEQALGGSESAVVYLAREMSRRGHSCMVYSHGQPGTFEGVQYRDVQELNQGVPACDVHISSRWVDILFASQAPFKALWLHDMPHPNMPPTLPVHLAVFLTKYHRDSWGAGEQDSVEVIGDGVDLTLFSGMEERSDTDLVWISNPDRGLYIACKIFREQILPRWPELRLVVYGRSAVYGWPGEVERPYLPPPEWLEDGHIILKEPLAKLALARELMRAWAMFYPTHWPETFCMAALEAQAAGLPVITSPLGALPETVKGGICTNDFVNAVSQLRNVSRWRKLSKLGKEQAQLFSWAAIAAQWEMHITNRMEEVAQ